MRTLVALVLLLVSGSLASADPQIDAIFAPFARNDAPGCVVGVYRAGEILATGAYGMADVAHGVPLTDTTNLSIASSTKPFTALAVLLLEAEGKIRLEDDVRKYVPEVPDFGTPITILDLLHHTSGLRDYWNLFNMAGWRSSDVETLDDVLWLVGRQRALNHPTGEEFLYTNTGYILLALVVERVSKSPFRTFVTERIFEPLGMTRSDVKVRMSQFVKGLATGYWGHDPTALSLATRPTAFAGNGGVMSNVRDLARWAGHLDEPRVGTRALLDAMEAPGRLKDGTTFGYGLGWFLGTHRGHRMVSHAGSDPGYKADFIRFPDERLAVTVLCNAFDIAPSPLALRVADLYLSTKEEPTAEAEASPASTGPSLDPRTLAGLYWQAATGGVYRILFEDGGLFLGSAEGKFALAGQGGNVYRLTAAPRRYLLTFAKRPDGSLTVEQDIQGSARRTYERVPEARMAGTPYRELAGTYESPELDVTWTFAVRSGTLVLERRRMDPDPLKRLFGDVFETETGYVVEFERGKAMNVITERVRRLRFTRTRR